MPLRPVRLGAAWADPARVSAAEAAATSAPTRHVPVRSFFDKTASLIWGDAERRSCKRQTDGKLREETEPLAGRHSTFKSNR